MNKVSIFQEPPDWSRWCRLAYKELIEILRDRRTIITLVGMPLLVYPLMGILIQKLMLQSVTTSDDPMIVLGVETEEQGRQFSAWIRLGDQLARVAQAEINRLNRETDVDPVDLPTFNRQHPETLETRIEFKKIETLQMQAGVRAGDIDVGFIQQEPTELGGCQYRLIYKPGSRFSENAYLFVSQRLRLANEHFARQWIISQELPVELPCNFFEEEVPWEAGPPVLMTFLPLMLVLMTMTGAVYPAIDLTAGERERGTMEILVAAPISRLLLLLGKFVAVLTVAVLTALANLLAMLITIYSLGLESIVFGETGLPWGIMGVMLALLVVLAGFFSATLLGLTSFARSFKEAQAYLIPLMMLAFTPGLLSLTPNLVMNSGWAVVPLANVVLAGRDLLTGHAQAQYVLITLVSTVLYGLLSLTLAAKVFGADSILTGGAASWSDLFHTPGQARDYPEFSTAILFATVLFPVYVLVVGLSNNWSTRWEASIQQRLWVNAGVTAMLFGGLPLTLAQWSQIRIRSAFFLFRPQLKYWLAAILLGTAVWVWVYEFEVSILTFERLEQFFQLFRGMEPGLATIPLVVKLVCLALVPAICEEITFRGFLLSSFARSLPPWAAVLGTAILFGLFHVMVRDLLIFERMLTSTLMGILLAYVCLRSGSLLPGILLHAVHNSLLIAVSHYQDYLKTLELFSEGERHLPASWLLLAWIPITIGLLILIRWRSSLLDSVNWQR